MSSDNGRPQLTDTQLRRLAAARVLAGAEADDLSAGYEYVDPRNRTMVYSFAFGMAKVSITELLEIIGALTGDTQ